MKLTGKVILIIISTVAVITSLLFYILLLRFEKQLEQNHLSTARAVYKNILLVRKWVSDYNGVYVIDRETSHINSYLPNPVLLTRSGDSLMLKNPALVTRELSELSRTIGSSFAFHLASRNFINPNNRPNDFEDAALNFYSDSLQHRNTREFYRVEERDGYSYFRYFAPLFTEESCLSCHSAQGYHLGDLRGGISIFLRMDSLQQARRGNMLFIFFGALLTTGILSLLIFIAFQRNFIRPLKEIEEAARLMQQGNYQFQLNPQKADEIGNLARAFEDMRRKIQTSTDQLKASEVKYRSLIENSPDAVAIVDRNGFIIECNTKLKSLTGYSSDELRNRDIHSLLHCGPDFQITTEKLKLTGGSCFEARVTCRDARKIPVEINVTGGIVLDGSKDLSFLYVRDISERKKIERYAIQTEKMVALGQLSAGIAHEIRNPLFSLNNNLDYLNRKANGNSSFKEVYPELQDGINRIQKIVSAILDYSRPHKPEMKEILIEEVIQKTLLLVQKKFENSATTIITRFAENSRPLYADPHQMEQVFINLILNSMAAMKNAGTLTITTRPKPQHLVVEVADTGKGVAEEDLNRIFDPFFSTSPNGTGMGLPIVQRILEQHRARYSIESRLYEGTRLRIYLPYKQENEYEI
ncbi:MAG: ATP-binding protein [Calditrichia bacterium]